MGRCDNDDPRVGVRFFKAAFLVDFQPAGTGDCLNVLAWRSRHSDSEFLPQEGFYLSLPPKVQF
jgi:hypothetical protein